MQRPRTAEHTAVVVASTEVRCLTHRAIECGRTTGEEEQGEHPANQPPERFIEVSLREDRTEVNHNVRPGGVCGGFEWHWRGL